MITFPPTPTLNDIYTSPDGRSWKWNGTAWRGVPPLGSSQVQSDWDATSGIGEILHKPTIPAAFDATALASVSHAATTKTPPVDADEIPIVDSAASNVLKKLTWANLKATAKAYFDGLYATFAQGANADAHRVDVEMYGFLNQTETTLAFDPAGGTTPNNGLFTLGSVGASWSYYAKGIKYTITGAKTVVVPDATTATTAYFVYIDNNVTTGALTCTTSPWNLNDDGRVPVATITRNSALDPTYLIGDERHTVKIMRRDHMHEHYSAGATYASGGDLSGLTALTDTLTAITPGVAAVKWFDEDIYHSSPAITDNQGLTTTPYTVFYKTGANAWAWARSLVPFRYSGAGFIQITNNTAGTIAGVPAYTTGAFNTAGSNNYVNYFMFVSNANGQEAVAWIPGQALHSSTSLAYAETWASINIAGLPIQDGVAVWMFTYRLNGSQLGKVTLTRLPVRVSGSIVTSSAVVSIAHDGLAGLGTAGAGVTFGHVNDTTQTFAGDKTFSGDILTVGDTLIVKELEVLGRFFYSPVREVAVLTSSGTWTVPENVDTLVSVLVVAGGGGGGRDPANGGGSGGGGGGGIVTASNLSVTPGQQISLTIGAAGVGATTNTAGGAGGNSVFGSLTTAVGGGGGGAYPVNGGVGGSGGGSGFHSSTAGAGTSSQGYAGGQASGSLLGGAGGGGGAGGAGGAAASTLSGGAGGVGLASLITGSEVYYAGGGGGGAHDTGTGGAGTGGGGNGAVGASGTAGSANTGGGGGGSGRDYHGGNGGSGVIILRY